MYCQCTAIVLHAPRAPQTHSPEQSRTQSRTCTNRTVPNVPKARTLRCPRTASASPMYRKCTVRPPRALMTQCPEICPQKRALCGALAPPLYRHQCTATVLRAPHARLTTLYPNTRRLRRPQCPQSAHSEVPSCRICTASVPPVYFMYIMRPPRNTHHVVSRNAPAAVSTMPPQDRRVSPVHQCRVPPHPLPPS
jgi:hypothetical protein